MAYQIQPLTPLGAEEVKEINKEDFQECFEIAQQEIFRLKTENSELVFRLEKLTKKLDKKKLKLEAEKTNSNTLRQFIQEINTKVQMLERAAPPPPVNPSIQSLHIPAMHPVIGEEFVERLVIAKTGLESQVYEQKREIEFLNSELISYKNKLTHKTESHIQDTAINQEAAQVHTELLLRDKQLEECRYKYLRLEAECQLGKQLFREALNSLSAEKEQLQLEMEHPDRRRLIGELDNANDQIVKLKRTNIANEEQLKKKIQELGNGNMKLTININTLNKQIAEQNKQIIALEQTQLDREKSQTLLETKDKQISDLRMQILDLKEKEHSYQTQVDEQIRELIEEKFLASERDLGQNAGILQNNSQVAQTTSTPLMPANPSKRKDDKKLAKLSNDQSKEKQTESSGATNYNMTPRIVPVAIKLAGIKKIILRPGKMVSVVKLKYLPDPLQYRGEQVIQSVNRRYELGVLMIILEIPGKDGFRNVNQKYVGINLCNPVGNSSGEFRTKRYFECEPNCGIFVPFEDVLVPVA